MTEDGMPPARTRSIACAIALAALAAAPPAAPAPGEILTAPPVSPAPGKDYLIFLHGRIVEEEGTRPTHPRHGVYEYRAILEAFAQEGFTVISEARPKGTDVEAYARKVVDQVRRMLQAGVPPRRLSVVGFSKGGMIATLVSSRLGEDQVGFAILAGCGGLSREQLAPGLRGRVLSLYDASDDVATSCASLLEAVPGPREHREEVLHTGSGHGAFFRPGAWVRTVAAWLRSPAGR